ncbi:MAG: ferrous iron transport protein B [Leptospira sp.]|nr:ferrous iron transport protein B [Leptospira sp.]
MNEISNIFLVGNPNSGKSTIFNHLTGLKQKTGNFSGVTVEKKTGSFIWEDIQYFVTDLPGTYGIGGVAEDKKIAYQVLLERKPNDKVLYVLDSLNLERGIQLLLQILDMGLSVLVALTMKDVLEKKKIKLKLTMLEKELGLHFVLINAKSGDGIQSLKDAIKDANSFKKINRVWHWDQKEETFLSKLKKELKVDSNEAEFFLVQSLKYLNKDPLIQESRYLQSFPKSTQERIETEFKKGKYNFSYEEEVIHRSFFIKALISKTIEIPKEYISTLESSIDTFFLHPFWGFLSFLFFMSLLFQSLFFFAEIPMSWIEIGIGSLQSFMSEFLPPGPFQSLVAEGIIGGVGSVVTFVPQIALLFLFIGILEESGYLARVSFLMDKIMGKFGLSGKSFIPLLSSAACAVPAILGTRTIENKSDRLTTILVSPLVMCSARYPVYILITGTVFVSPPIFGFLNIQGLVLFSMFTIGLTSSLIFALIFRKTVFKDTSSYFIIELPRYMIPSFRSLWHTVFSKIKSFLSSAGQVILYISIVLWALSYFPNPQSMEAANERKIENSYIGQFGKKIEPLLVPMGFDWKIGISILTSFAAREVMVSTLSVLYGSDGGEESENLRTSLKNETRKDGTKVWTPLTGLSLLVFFAFASQCMSTLAVTRKETGTIWIPLLQFFYMTSLAILSSSLIFQLGKALGFE